MLPLRFVAFDDLRGVPNVVVDGSPGDATLLTLSHWPGSPTPPELLADLSAEIAFRALDEPQRFTGIEAVSNNHFDQDGLCGVYALVDPVGALARRDLVIDVASAGDFGTFRSRDAARIAMTIAAFDSARSPFADELAGLAYPQACALLYERSLPLMTDLLDRPDDWSHLWADEDAHLQASLDALADGTVTVTEHPDVDLAVFTVPESWSERVASRFTMARDEALHPMAVNSSTSCLRVLVQHGGRPRLELRYETWVMLVSRRPLPRPDLGPLVPRLAELETGGATWHADAPGSLTPQLQVTGDGESTIAPDHLTELIVDFLRTAPPAWDPFAPH